MTNATLTSQLTKFQRAELPKVRVDFRRVYDEKKKDGSTTVIKAKPISFPVITSYLTQEDFAGQPVTRVKTTSGDIYLTIPDPEGKVEFYAVR